MKKFAVFNRCYFRLVVLCFALLLAGCVSAATPISYDNSAPPEKCCTLNVIATLTVKEFDGKTVNWAAGFGDSWAAVQIPEGSHTFVLDYSRQVQGGYHHQENIVFRYDGFVAGRIYEMIAAEGAEGRSFAGLGDVIDTMQDTANQTLRILVTDVTK